MNNRPQIFTNVYKRLQILTIDYKCLKTVIQHSFVDFRVMEIREQLSAGNIYHICTRSVGQEYLFRDTRDYFYFSRKMNERLSAAWEILAFSLVPNEIHLVVRIIKKKIDGEVVNHSTLLSHLLNGYVQHYNYKYGRSGSLLSRSFRRKSLQSEKEIQETICKIHNLPLAQNLSRKNLTGYIPLTEALRDQNLAENI